MAATSTTYYPAGLVVVFDDEARSSRALCLSCIETRLELILHDSYILKTPNLHDNYMFYII